MARGGAALQRCRVSISIDGRGRAAVARLLQAVERVRGFYDGLALATRGAGRATGACAHLGLRVERRAGRLAPRQPTGPDLSNIPGCCEPSALLQGRYSAWSSRSRHTRRIRLFGVDSGRGSNAGTQMSFHMVHHKVAQAAKRPQRRSAPPAFCRCPPCWTCCSRLLHRSHLRGRASIPPPPARRTSVPAPCHVCASAHSRLKCCQPPWSKRGNVDRCCCWRQGRSARSQDDQ